jgi:hypothetical protein
MESIDVPPQKEKVASLPGRKAVLHGHAPDHHDPIYPAYGYYIDQRRKNLRLGVGICVTT